VIATICPYCRGEIDSSPDQELACEGCGTQHHRDCYEENGGCTVFGCRCAPAEEPKLSIATPDLAQPPAPGTVRPYSAPSPPPPPVPGTSVQPVVELPAEPLGSSVVPSIFSSYPEPEPESETVHEPRSRTTFILLGALLGPLGAHNFYAGYKKKGFTQLGITAVTVGYAAPMTWIWAIIDICTIDRDNNGVNFTS
jgi:TM2 domain-containing membrane protein YozV